MMMFTKRSFSLVCLCLSAPPVDSGRIKTTQEELAADSSKLTAKRTTDNNAALQQFIDDTQLKSCQGACRGMLIGNLVEGLVASNLVKEITWEAPKLSVTLNDGVDHAYGQIATRSKVPVAWVVDNQFFATKVIGDGITTMQLEGLHTEVSRQGIGIYKQVMEAQIVSTNWGKKVFYEGNGTLMERAGQYDSICADPTSHDCNEYLEYERKAAANWLKFNSKEFIKGSGKISKIVKTGISNKVITWDNWGSILFSMITSAGKNIDELIFSTEGDAIIARASQWEGSQSSKDVDAYSLLPKAQTIGGKALTNCPAMLASTVAKAAKSGWGFGMLFAHGDPAVKDQVKKYPKAQPAKLVDLFSLCEEGAFSGTDPECSGKTPGRIHWTDSLPQDYLEE